MPAEPADRPGAGERRAGDWRSVLAPRAAVGADAGAPRAAKPLALQLELRHRVRRLRADWQGRREETARDVHEADRLAARPVTAGARGNWIKGDLSWQNVGFRGESAGFAPEQARWFANFSMLRSRGGYLSHGSDWLVVDDYESGLLWAELAEAERLGIPIVGSAIAPVVEVAGRAELGFDVREHADGALTLTPVVELDGAVHPAGAARRIADHGVYLVDAEQGRLTLAPFAGPLGAEQAAAFDAGVVEVPAADAEEFLAAHYPRLARSTRFTSADGSFEPPPAPPPVLVLDATFGAGHRLRLAWHWEAAGVGELELDAGDDDFGGPVDRGALALAAERVGADPAGEPALLPRVAGGDDEPRLQPFAELRGVAAAEFASRVLPELEALRGVAVRVTGIRPEYRELSEAPKLAFTAHESEKHDWFDLGVSVTVAGRTVPFEPLFRALSKGRKKLLLVDGSYLSLTQSAFDPLRELLEEAESLDEWEPGTLPASRYRAMLWAEFEDLGDESASAIAWRETVAAFRGGAEVEPLPPPAGLALELRPYQLEGFRWLAFLHRHRLGGVLADDMGLGKTAQTLALIAHAREESFVEEARQRRLETGDADRLETPAPSSRAPRRTDAAPFLVVAPTSVVSNWANEAARFTPGLVVRTVTATRAKRRTALAELAAGTDVVVTSYAILRFDAEEFQAADWAGLVLDEAQFAKNPASKVHQAARDIRAPFRLAVTGTPIENHLGELQAVFELVAPGLFPSASGFRERYRRPIESGSAERLATLRRRIRPLMLRRTKEQVAPELPEKQEQVLEVELDERHRRLYDGYLQRERQKLLDLVDDLDRNRFIVFRSITLLRMLALDAGLIDEQYAALPSAKLDALLEQLDELVAEGHRALVFSQFTSFLDRAAARLDAAGIAHVTLDGSTPGRARERVIRRFRDGEAPVFLISLKAGGVGLNLTEADYVFLLDPWWNPASEEQAVDRAHRIGQSKRVNVYRMVAAGTIEEKVMALKAKKARLVASVVDDDALFSEQLTADDIRGLFEG